MKFTPITATLAALVISGAAFAQAPAPHQRTMNPSIHDAYPTQEMSQQAYAAPDPAMRAYPAQRAYMGRGVPLARRLPNGTWVDPNGGLQKDRFGNIVRGESCAQHWSNCAFDASRPQPPMAAVQQ